MRVQSCSWCGGCVAWAEAAGREVAGSDRRSLETSREVLGRETAQTGHRHAHSGLTRRCQHGPRPSLSAALPWRKASSAHPEAVREAQPTALTQCTQGFLGLTPPEHRLRSL